MYILATGRVWFLGMVKISDQNAWRWCLWKWMLKRIQFLNLYCRIVVWVAPANLYSLLEFGIAFDVHSSPFLASLPSLFPICLELPEHLEFVWGKVVNTAMKFHRDGYLGCRSRRIFSSIGTVPSWHQLSSATWFCFLCGCRYYFKFRDKKKKEEFISMWLLSFVPYVNGGVVYLHILHSSEAPLETTRRWLAKKTRPTGSLV